MGITSKEDEPNGIAMPLSMKIQKWRSFSGGIALNRDEVDYVIKAVERLEEESERMARMLQDKARDSMLDSLKATMSEDT